MGSFTSLRLGWGVLIAIAAFCFVWIGKESLLLLIHYEFLRHDCPRNETVKNECLAEHIARMTIEEGTEQSFSLVKWLYLRETGFAPGCYRFAIDVGSKVFAQETDYTKLSFSPESTFCNFGFILEYARKLTLGYGPDKGGIFCAYIAAVLQEDVPGVREECLRGVGKALPFGKKKEVDDSVIRRAADLCTQLALTKEEE